MSRASTRKGIATVSLVRIVGAPDTPEVGDGQEEGPPVVRLAPVSSIRPVRTNSFRMEAMQFSQSWQPRKTPAQRCSALAENTEAPEIVWINTSHESANWARWMAPRCTGQGRQEQIMGVTYSMPQWARSLAPSYAPNCSTDLE